MITSNFKETPKEDEERMGWDLRAYYANIVGLNMVDINEARKAKNFYEWLKSIENLWTICNFRFYSDESEKEEVFNKYNEYKSKVLSLANKYRQTWKGLKNDEKEIEEIENALRELENFVYFQMKKAKMFGDLSFIDEGL